jgi:rhodanese-related sulfurtransferase
MIVDVRSIRASGVLVALILFGCARFGGLTMGDVKRDLSERFPDVPVTSVAELQEMMSADAGLVLIDAREVEEFSVSHLKGAEHAVIVAEVRPLLREVGVPVVVYCSVGYRSAELADRLIRASVPGVYNFPGSIFEWANAGLPLYRGDELVKEVHPYDDHWGRLLDPRQVRISKTPSPAE